MTSQDLDAAKDAVRTQIWDELEHSGAVAAGVHGRIPDFNGSDLAAQRLSDLDLWRTARVVKAVPDSAQGPVRALALAAGKLLYMAVPKLAKAEPFYRLDPASLTVAFDVVAGSRDTARVGTPVDVDAMRPIDLVVTGSVAVNSTGARLGKGAGYLDIEIALLAQADLIGTDTTIVTTVHDAQVVEEALPEDEHDAHVDLIVTPTRTIECTQPKRPPGIDWATMPATKIDQIPALARRRPAGHTTHDS